MKVSVLFRAWKEGWSLLVFELCLATLQRGLGTSHDDITPQLWEICDVRPSLSVVLPLVPLIQPHFHYACTLGNRQQLLIGFILFLFIHVIFCED